MEKKYKECYKCKEKATFFYKNELFVCSTCFLKTESQKFGSFLRSKMDVYGENLKVFCIFDGSLNSLVCCDLFIQRNKYTHNPK